MTPKLLPLLALPVLLLASCGSSTTTPPEPPQQETINKADQTKSAEEQSVLEQINKVRATARICGSKLMPAADPVTWNDQLAAAAHGHAQDMAEKGYFGHYSQDGRTVDDRIEAAGYTGWRFRAENLAGGYGPTKVLKSWLESPSHCEALMDGKLKEVGLGYVFKPGSKFSTYWVSNFGTSVGDNFT